MLYVVIVYNRNLGASIVRQDFTDPDEAWAARVQADLEFGREPDVEVCLIGGASVDELANSFPRYFR